MARTELQEWCTDREETSADRPTLAVVRPVDWHRATIEMRQRFEQFVGDVSARAELDEIAMPAPFTQAAQVHRVIMAREAHQGWLKVGQTDDQRLSRSFRDLLEEGARVGAKTYERALALRHELIDQMTSWSTPFDALLTLATTGEAPGRGTTGDPRFCIPWTLVGAPTLSFPIGLGTRGLPLAAQFVGAPGRDRAVLEVTHLIELTREPTRFPDVNTAPARGPASGGPGGRESPAHRPQTLMGTNRQR
jgi:amidase